MANLFCSVMNRSISESRLNTMVTPDNKQSTREGALLSLLKSATDMCVDLWTQRLELS